jgi:hypothetical protein
MLPYIEPIRGKLCRSRTLVVYQQSPKSVFYKPLDGPQRYVVLIVIRPGPGLPWFSKGSQDGELVLNPFTPLDPLSRGSVVIFRASLYRQESEVRGEGCIAIVLKYE